MRSSSLAAALPPCCRRCSLCVLHTQAAEHPELAAELWDYAQELTGYRSPLQ